MPGKDRSGSTDRNEHVRIHECGSNNRTLSSVETVEPEDVFENPSRPRRKEAVSALVDVGFLSSLEAEAYIRYVIEGQEADEEQSFSLSSVKSAKEKLAAAQESLGILSAYENPKQSDECSECAGDLGDTWTVNLADNPICLDCAEAAHPNLDS
jgi:hypothetical protein